MILIWNYTSELSIISIQDLTLSNIFSQQQIYQLKSNSNTFLKRIFKTLGFFPPNYTMATFTKNAITLFNNVKIILKLLKPLTLIKSSLLHLFYIEKCHSVSYNTKIGCWFLAQIYQLRSNSNTSLKKILKTLGFSLIIT